MSSNPRRSVVETLVGAQPVASNGSFREQSLLDLFGINVFGDREMRARLSDADYAALRETALTGKPLAPNLAGFVAQGMKDWALERGATHFTHWFQPMTGLTAEKHDSFLRLADGEPLVEFSGKELIKGEPDASSFPSGGLRSTFEARGYTAWDPTSPAFIREGVNGATLCIPTAFCSWTGEALDKKTPLLRSDEALCAQALRLLRALGDQTTKWVWSTAGPEQEFFLIDRGFFLLRPDLVATGRTLLGARPPKGQELEDHYFGSMPPRVLACLQEVERELWKLGVPVKTRHNEVAPSQFEIAPIFERSTVACDHNMLTMELLRQVAAKHGLVCLLHEKPFSGINGSGKHNNWSMSTDQGENLLEPGSTPADNARFIVFLTAVIRAVDLHADVLRISVARPGNDHRLGANEAPPAIMSIYLGAELDNVCRVLMGERVSAGPAVTHMQLGVSSLPQLPRDSTDRNRTSPFAFTGNKFEFRAVGAGQSIADPNIALNTIAADSLSYMAEEIQKHEPKLGLEGAVQKVVQATLKTHYRVVFNGNNYSQSWHREAETRGLPNFRNTPEAIGHFATAKNIALFAKLNVLAENELRSRANVMYENYAKAIAIEAQCCHELATTTVLPAAMHNLEQTARALAAAREVAPRTDLRPQERLFESMIQRLNELIDATRDLQAASEEAEKHEEQITELVTHYRDKVLPAMRRTRAACDALETMVDDDLWLLPRYREMLFLH